MEFEQDYIMRMIKSIVSFFIKLITGKSDTVYELPSDGLYTPCDDIFARILSLADGGKINEAENLLYANVEPDSKDYLLMGLTFYSHINEYTDNFLSDHNYSRQEIQDGSIAFTKEFTIDEMNSLSLYQTLEEML